MAESEEEKVRLFNKIRDDDKLKKVVNAEQRKILLKFAQVENDVNTEIAKAKIEAEMASGERVTDAVKVAAA